MNHAERYEYLVNKMAAIRWRGSDLDASYYAALFLMASHPALFQKMDRYLCPEGIDFTKMMRKEEFEYDWMKITADAGVLLESRTAAVLQVDQNGQRIVQNLVMALTVDIGKRADATCIVVEFGAIKALLLSGICLHRDPPLDIRQSVE